MEWFFASFFFDKFVSKLKHELKGIDSRLIKDMKKALMADIRQVNFLFLKKITKFFLVFFLLFL